MMQAQPLMGVKIRPPMVKPSPGMVVVAYELHEPQLCDCVALNMNGLIAIVVVLLIFWPLCWIPLLTPCSYDKFQVPIYGFPQPGSQLQPPMPYAPPQMVPSYGGYAPPQPYGHPPPPAAGWVVPPQGPPGAVANKEDQI